MQLTTSNKRWLTNGRRVEASIHQMSSNIWISSERIRSFEITDTITDGNTIMIGTASSRSLTMELTNLTSTEVAGLYQYVRFNLLTNLRSPDVYTDMVNQGFFVVDSVEKVAHADGTFDATVQAYDFMYLLDKKCNLTPPNGYITIRQMITNILTALNIPNNGVSSTWSTNIKINSVPTDITYREFIGYLAGLQGCVAHFVPSNTGYIITYNYDVLTAMWFEDVIDPSTSQRFLIDATWQYAQGLSVDGESVTINHVEGGVTSDENDLKVYPNDATYNLSQTMSFVNPYLDKTKDSTDASYTATARLEKIGESLGLDDSTIQYVPLTVNWFGMPCIRVGSIVNVEEYVTSSLSRTRTMYVMEKQISFDGSLSETYVSKVNTETGVNFNPTNLVQYVKHSVSVLEKEIEQATNVIEQCQDGVFELISANDPNDPSKNVGWKIHSTYDPSEIYHANNVITANSHGIGFSIDGGQTYATAIYLDSNGGHIVGQYLVAGSIEADKIAAGAITSEKLYAGAVTTDKLSVGSGKVANKFFNDEFNYTSTTTSGYIYTKAIHWETYNVSTVANIDYAPVSTYTSESGKLYAWSPCKARDLGFCSIHQSVYMEKGKRYSIIAQVTPNGNGTWTQNASSKYITYFVNYVAFNDEMAETQDMDDALSSTGETIIKITFDYTGDTGYAKVGLAWKGMKTNDSLVTMNVAWLELIRSPGEELGFYSSRPKWLKSEYRQATSSHKSHVIECDTPGMDTTPDEFLVTNGMSVDANGNLTISGNLESYKGNIGITSYDQTGLSISGKFSSTGNFSSTWYNGIDMYVPNGLFIGTPGDNVRKSPYLSISSNFNSSTTIKVTLDIENDDPIIRLEKGGLKGHITLAQDTSGGVTRILPFWYDDTYGGYYQMAII